MGAVRHDAVARAADPGRDRLRLWLKLLRLTRRIEGELRERLRVDFQMTLPRFDVLSALDRSSEGMMMTELSRMLMVSNGNVTGIIDRLVEDGLVLRSLRDGDRRASVVRLTEKGKLRFAELAEVHKQWVDELLGGLDSEEAHAVIGLLGRATKDGDS
jgi:DNA-binding MarR family transcriptional regulator